MEQRIVNQYGAAYTPLAEAFNEIEREHDKAVRQFIETNKLTPLEITLLEGIYGHKVIFAECRLRTQMAIRKAERGASPLLNRKPACIEPNPADRH